MTTQEEPNPAVPPWELHHRLDRALEHQGLKVHEMRDLIGVSDSTMSNYLSGKTKPRAGLLRIWAMRCGVSYQWLHKGAVEPSDGPGGQEVPPTIWKRNVVPLRRPQAA